MGEEWENLKPRLSWNTVLVLEKDGTQLSTSTAILLYLGRKFNLAGADELKAAKCNEYFDSMNDVRIECKALSMEEDESKKVAIKEKIQSKRPPWILKKFEEIWQKNGNGVLVGGSVICADIFVAHFLIVLCEWIEVKLESFPSVSAHPKQMFNLQGIKEWIAKRPVTQY